MRKKVCPASSNRSSRANSSGATPSNWKRSSPPINLPSILSVSTSKPGTTAIYYDPLCIPKVLYYLHNLKEISIFALLHYFYKQELAGQVGARGCGAG